MTSPARLATARCLPNERDTCSSIVLTLITVKLGSSSAKIFFRTGSSVPGGILVTSMAARIARRIGRPHRQRLSFRGQ